jgi:hypothetical protein
MVRREISKDGAMGAATGGGDTTRQNIVPQKNLVVKIKIVLTIATRRVLPNMLQCYRCHMLGHNSLKCSAISTGKELCRRCGATDHIMKDCINEPRYAICAKENRTNL